MVSEFDFCCNKYFLAYQLILKNAYKTGLFYLKKKIVFARIWTPFGTRPGNLVSPNPSSNAFIPISISRNFNSCPSISYISISIIAKYHRRLPKTTKYCQRFPTISKDCQRSPKIAKYCQRWLKIAEDCQRSPKIAKNRQRLQKIEDWGFRFQEEGCQSMTRQLIPG